MSIGRYNGQNYKRQRICDVMAVSTTASWWFLYDEDDRPTGDHFASLDQLRQYVDSPENELARTDQT